MVPYDEATTEIFAIWEYDSYEAYEVIEKQVRGDKQHANRVQKWYEENGGREYVLSEYILKVKNEQIESTLLNKDRYSYQELVRDIHIGHEIEFTYKGKRYITLNVLEGFGLCEDNVSVSYYKNPEELIKNGEIDGKSLKDIWNDVEDISIF
ncbi:cytoplasmic protein [Oceanobacillus picturae]|uniref:Cytoplasmic protein n=1 Tax=Oceanobacillus picturae TaxID=171693 RepID=A0A0U9HAL4_9BACI|nr:cytoplasmic protein [Oceanobacillus picturae]